jgi:hypothetical protein
LIRFSVILPVRNGWPYVEECVNSILAQTYPHFDLIALDNCSTDATVEWLRSRNDPRIRICTSTVSLSIVDSWARAMHVERHEYMTLIGHDDKFDPDFLETIKNLIERHPESSLYQTGGRLINSQGRTVRSCVPVPEIETAAQYLKARFTFNRDNFGTGFVMRSADYDRVGGIPPFERLSFADDALWLALVGSGSKACDPGEHFSIRVHPGSESASLPSFWRLIISGLASLTEFLSGFVRTNAEAHEIYRDYGPDFMLTYHRNAMIMALVEASEAGQRIDSATIDRIRASLMKSAPDQVGKLFRSPKVAVIAALNASPLRSVLPVLWSLYSRLKTRS